MIMQVFNNPNVEVQETDHVPVNRFIPWEGFENLYATACSRCRANKWTDTERPSCDHLDQPLEAENQGGFSSHLALYGCPGFGVVVFSREEVDHGNCRRLVYFWSYFRLGRL